jgi:hypothetical protein
MRRGSMALAFACGVLAAGGVEAATLVNVSGDVLVNTGRGFVRATEGQRIDPGNRVMIGSSGGAATIVYDPLCIERVERGRAVIVQQGVPCTVAGASTTPAPVGAGISQGALIVGGVAIAVGAGVLIYNASKSSSSP